MTTSILHWRGYNPRLMQQPLNWIAVLISIAALGLAIVAAQPRVASSPQPATNQGRFANERPPTQAAYSVSREWQRYQDATNPVVRREDLERRPVP